MQARVERRGVATWRRDGGPDDCEPYRFLELVHREGTGRYDMPLPWCAGGAMRGDVKLADAEASAFAALHGAMDEVARPVVDALWGDGAANDEAPRAGCVISEPGASAQPWHRDGPDGLVDVFSPLVELTPRNGPTDLKPGTHLDGDDGDAASFTIAPLLEPRDLLFFDYRCLHRGRANEGAARREVAYVVYARRGAKDVQNFPAAATLEYD